MAGGVVKIPYLRNQESLVYRGCMKLQTNKNSKYAWIRPLREGLGEIGKEYGWWWKSADDLAIVDAASYVSRRYDMPGVDLVIPGHSPMLMENASRGVQMRSS